MNFGNNAVRIVCAVVAVALALPIVFSVVSMIAG